MPPPTRERSATLFLYPLEPQTKDCVDTPEGNLESGAVVSRQMEESTAPTDQRCFDRATSQHVYIPWLLIHEIFCQTRRLSRSSCDALVAGSWSPSPRTPASARCPFPRLSGRGAAATLCNGAVTVTRTATRRKGPAAENLAAEMLNGSSFEKNLPESGCCSAVD